MGTIRRFLNRWVAAVLLIAFSAATARADATDDRIAALQAKFRCPIFDYLQAVHKYPTPQRMDNRFLIVTVEHLVMNVITLNALSTAWTLACFASWTRRSSIRR